eukprot:3356913-Pyramimonas_sp.AAC.1
MSDRANTAGSDKCMSCRGWRSVWPTADLSGKVMNTFRSSSTVGGSSKGQLCASGGNSGSPSP